MRATKPGEDAESSRTACRASKTLSDTGLTAVIRETTRLWRGHGLGYDQTKYLVVHMLRELALATPTARRRSVDRLDSMVWREPSVPTFEPAPPMRRPAHAT